MRNESRDLVSWHSMKMSSPAQLRYFRLEDSDPELVILDYFIRYSAFPGLFYCVRRFKMKTRIMEWERKFSTIVTETEANLDRVRRRLEAARNSRATDIPVLSGLPVFSGDENVISKGYRAPTLASRSSESRAAGYQGEMGSNTPAGPPVWVTILEEKINKQNKTIESLEQTVTALQNEKKRQTSLIQRLEESVKSLNQTLEDRIEERGVDLDTENRINLWKQETKKEINNLKSQVIHQRQSDSSRPTSRHSVDELLHQVSDAKHACREEAESARKDIDYYKTRMARLEKKLITLSEEFDVLNRRHTELRSDVTELEGKTKNDYKELSQNICQKLADVRIIRTELSDPKPAFPERGSFRQSYSGASPIQQAAGNTRSAIQQPTRWRELLSHSLSTVSVASSNSTLSSGYLARKLSKDSDTDEPDEVLAAGGLLDSSSSEEHNSMISTPSSSPTSLSINDL